MTSAANADRARYRANPALEATMPSMNIAHDPRVVRGVTAGRPMLRAAPPAAPAPPLRVQKETREAERARLVKLGLIRPQLKSTAEIHAHIVVAKKRTPLDLSQFLTEPARTVATSVETTQTDRFVTPPPSPPPFRARKVGRDAGCQVEDSAVFDFDRDVAALTQLIVGHTLEQTLAEVRREESSKNVSARTAALDSREQGRAREAEDRAAAEQERQDRLDRLRGEAGRRAAAEARVADLLRAHAFSRRALRGLQPGVVAELHEQGVVADAHARAVETQFLPWLLDKVRDNVRARGDAAALTDALLAAALTGEAARVREVAAGRAAEAAEKAAAEERAETEQRQRARVRLLIQTDLAAEPVALVLTGLDSVADVEARVRDWVRAFAQEHPDAMDPSVAAALLRPDASGSGGVCGSREEAEEAAAAAAAREQHDQDEEPEQEEYVDEEDGQVKLRPVARRRVQPQVAAWVRCDWGGRALAPETPLHAVAPAVLRSLAVSVEHDVKFFDNETEGADEGDAGAEHDAQQGDDAGDDGMHQQ